MSADSPLLATALGLLNHDLLVHLDEAEALAMQTGEWSDEDRDAARKLIDALVLMIRGLVVEHELQPGNGCRICGCAWPCPVIGTIHRFLKDPEGEFVALVHRARDTD